MNNVHFAIPEIYGETLSYYELLRKLVDKVNDLIDNYNTVPEQIAEEVKNLDASQLFSTVLNQLIHSIATDNTKSANAVKVYKKYDLLYATFNETVNLYESMVDFTTGTETELIIGTNIREVNISELFIELRELINALQNAINTETSSRKQADTTLQNAINTEKSVREKADTALQTKLNNGTLKIDELWSNNNNTTQFLPKTVNITTTEYKLLYILFKNYTFYGEIGELIIPTNNSSTYYALSVNTNNKGNIMSRGVKIVSDGVKFDDAFVVNTADNKAMIPLKIYGIK